MKKPWLPAIMEDREKDKARYKEERQQIEDNHRIVGDLGLLTLFSMSEICWIRLSASSRCRCNDLNDLFVRKIILRWWEGKDILDLCL